jgi:hypothetical protein
MAWIKASERRPTEADALDGWILWRANEDYRPFIDDWDAAYFKYEWLRILNETEQEPELPQPGQTIWVRHFDEDGWRQETLLRWKSYPVTASRSGKNETIWHEWSLTDPNKPPEPQYRPFANAEEFWPSRNCWWRIKGSDDLHGPRFFNDEKYGGSMWQFCFEKMELLEDVDGKMVARPFGLEVPNEA